MKNVAVSFAEAIAIAVHELALGTAKLACCSLVEPLAAVGSVAAPASGLDCLMFPQARPSKTDIPLRRCRFAGRCFFRLGRDEMHFGGFQAGPKF